LPEGIKTQDDLAKAMRREAIGKNPFEGARKRGRTEANKALDDMIAALMADGRERTLGEIARRVGRSEASIRERFRDSQAYAVDYVHGLGIWRLKEGAKARG
jgi:hypothetical protein